VHSFFLGGGGSLSFFLKVDDLLVMVHKIQTNLLKQVLPPYNHPRPVKISSKIGFSLSLEGVHLQLIPLN